MKGLTTLLGATAIACGLGCAGEYPVVNQDKRLSVGAISGDDTRHRTKQVQLYGAPYVSVEDSDSALGGHSLVPRAKVRTELNEQGTRLGMFSFGKGTAILDAELNDVYVARKASFRDSPITEITLRTDGTYGKREARENVSLRDAIAVGELANWKYKLDTTVIGGRECYVVAYDRKDATKLPFLAVPRDSAKLRIDDEGRITILSPMGEAYEFVSKPVFLDDQEKAIKIMEEKAKVAKAIQDKEDAILKAKADKTAIENSNKVSSGEVQEVK